MHNVFNATVCDYRSRDLCVCVCVCLCMKAGKHVVRSMVGPNDCSNKLRLSNKATMVSTVKERWQISSCAFQCCAMEVDIYLS